MERLLISLCGGVVLPLFLLALNFPATVIFGPGPHSLLLYSIGWPYFIWDPVFPPQPCNSCINLKAIIASVITDFVAYSLLTYLMQRPIEYLWRKWGLPMYERRSIDYTKIFSSE